jgi:hypothetical protein
MREEGGDERGGREDVDGSESLSEKNVCSCDIGKIGVLKWYQRMNMWRGKIWLF